MTGQLEQPFARVSDPQRLLRLETCLAGKWWWLCVYFSNYHRISQLDIAMPHRIPAWVREAVAVLRLACPGQQLTKFRIVATSEESPGVQVLYDGLVEAEAAAQPMNEGPLAMDLADVQASALVLVMTESELEVAWVLSGADDGMKATEVAMKMNPRCDPVAMKKRLQRMRVRGLVEHAASGGFRLTREGLSSMPDSI